MVTTYSAFFPVCVCIICSYNPYVVGLNLHTFLLVTLLLSWFLAIICETLFGLLLPRLLLLSNWMTL